MGPDEFEDTSSHGAGVPTCDQCEVDRDHAGAVEFARSVQIVSRLPDFFEPNVPYLNSPRLRDTQAGAKGAELALP